MNVEWEEMVATELGKARHAGATVDIDAFVDEALAKKRDEEYKTMTQDKKNAFIDFYNAHGAPLSYQIDEARAKRLTEILKKI